MDEDSAAESEDEVANLMGDTLTKPSKSDGADAYWFEGYEDDLSEQQTGPEVSEKLLPLVEKRFRKTLA
jgi:hypothetical protein